mmetsp:Transcript_12399/g.18212  ORF Transcript_12399/g.18212 Transcript_12399/m.18212 type:complete len:692 (-) Transcript_12399:104-2179(-)
MEKEVVTIATPTVVTSSTTTSADGVDSNDGFGAPDMENPSAIAPKRGGNVVLPKDTVPRQVLWQREHRSYTDKWWGVAYIVAYLAFLGCGTTISLNSNLKYESLITDGPTYVAKYFQDEVVDCCKSIADGDSASASVYDLCDELPPDLLGRRHRVLAEVGNSTFHGDEGIFDAFLAAPEIIAGMVGLAFVVALVWVVLLRFFAKPIVIGTEVVKIGLFIYVGIIQDNSFTQILCFLIAAGILAYAIWARESILFAGDVISYSTVAFQANPAMFVALLLIQVFFVGNALLFVYFFSQSFDVVEVVERTICTEPSMWTTTFGDGDDESEVTCYSLCVFEYPSYITGMSTYMSLAYLWTICLFHKMRLSVIATVIGSWHFHPEDKPGILTALCNTCTTSFGTLSVSALISTLAERIQQWASEPCWKKWLGPGICIALPLELLLCVFGTCISFVLNMLTKFAVIMHVWTGLPFVGSAKKVFAILSRHFKNGFVTELTSKSLLTLASYIFSICIALLSWLWFDDEFNTSTIPGKGEALYYLLFTISGLFTTWHPVLGLFLIIVADRVLRQVEYQHLWVSPLAALFVGCLTMMFFTYVSAIFLDTIDVIFLCFAVDKDNDQTENVDPTLVKLLEKVPAFVEVEVMKDGEGNAYNGGAASRYADDGRSDGVVVTYAPVVTAVPAAYTTEIENGATSTS